MNIVPIVHKIIEHEGIFYAQNKDEETIFATSNQEIANMYYAIPTIIENQAQTIKELTEKLNFITEEYNLLIMRLTPNGSSLVH